jgi:hypothetical protein
LPLDGETSPFAEPAQACHDLVVLNFFGRAAVFTDYELALMRVLGIATGDKCIGGFDPVDQLVGEQKVERTVNRGRTEFTALLLEFGEQRVGFCRLVGAQDQLENPPAHRRQPCAAERTNPLCTCERDIDLLRRHARPPAAGAGEETL